MSKECARKNEGGREGGRELRFPEAKGSEVVAQKTDLHERSLRLGRVRRENFVESSDEDGLDWVSQVLRMGVSEHPLVHPEGGTKGREREQRRARCESSEDYHLTCIVKTSTI